MTRSALIYVVDDDVALHSSMKWLLESVGLKVATFDSASAFLDALDPKQHGCAIIDVRMPGMSGLEAQKVLKERKISLPVIIMTGHGDIPIAVRAMKAGATDFVEKPFNDQEIIDRIQSALQLDLDGRPRREEERKFFNLSTTLSPRENEVLKLVIEGYPNKRIAGNLKLSEKTVEVHRSNMMKKLQVHSVAELVRLAVATGF